MPGFEAFDPVPEPPSLLLLFSVLHEVKHDGYRLQVHVRAGRVRPSQ